MKYGHWIFLLFISTKSLGQSQFGVQLYSFRNQFRENIPATLKQIREMGVRVVEGGDSYGMPASAFKELLDQHQLQVVSIGADFQELHTNLPAIIERARLYGAAYVVCFWIPHSGETLTRQEADIAISRFNEAGRVLHEAGLSLCYHPHGFEFAAEGNGTLFDYLVTNTHPRFVHFEMDVFWIKQPGQNPLALLHKYPDRFRLMHLKDRKPGTPSSYNGKADVETNVVLGQGDVGIKEMVLAARKLKIPYLFIEDESSRSLRQVPESLKFLRQIR